MKKPDKKQMMRDKMMRGKKRKFDKYVKKSTSECKSNLPKRPLMVAAGKGE